MSPAAVKRALAALAEGDRSAEDRSDREPPAHVIETARTALDDIETAVDFVADNGLVRLRRAVALAERHGHTDLVRTGTEVLDAVNRYSRAAAGGTPDSFHFHSGRGTVLGSNGEGMNR